MVAGTVGRSVGDGAPGRPALLFTNIFSPPNVPCHSPHHHCTHLRAAIYRVRSAKAAHFTSLTSRKEPFHQSTVLPSCTQSDTSRAQSKDPLCREGLSPRHVPSQPPLLPLPSTNDCILSVSLCTTVTLSASIELYTPTDMMLTLPSPSPPHRRFTLLHSTPISSSSANLLQHSPTVKTRPRRSMSSGSYGLDAKGRELTAGQKKALEDKKGGKHNDVIDTWDPTGLGDASEYRCVMR